MRTRAWIAIAAASLGLLLGIIGRSADVEALDLLSGLAWIAAIVLGVSLLPFWKGLLPEVAPMPGLFAHVPEGHRWCNRCGTPAPKRAACRVCGHALPVKAPKPPKPAKQNK